MTPKFTTNETPQPGGASRFTTNRTQRWRSEPDVAFLANIDAARRTDTAMIRRRYYNPLLRVQALLGHRSLDTTMRYLQVLMQESRSVIPGGDSWTEAFLADGVA